MIRFTSHLRSNRLPGLRRTMPAATHAIVQKVVFDVQAGAQQRAPVDTGALRGSIQGRMTDAAAGEVAVGVEYAPYVEYGTRHAPAQPYLTPAADAARPGFEGAIAAALKGA